MSAARAAFPGWRSTPSIERARKLFTLRERLLANSDRLARSVTAEMGKTLPDFGCCPTPPSKHRAMTTVCLVVRPDMNCPAPQRTVSVCIVARLG